MNKKMLGLLIASLALTSLQANDISYNHADLTFNSYDDADGYTIGGSFEFYDNAYAIGQLSNFTLDNINIDYAGLQLGVGYHYEIAPSTDVLAELSFLNLDIDGGNGISIDDSGYILAFGLRKMLMPNVEFLGKIEYVDIFEGSETDFEIGGMYYFENQFALGLSYETNGNNDLDGLILRGRYRFK